MTYTDVSYVVEDQIAFITIERPELRNALRSQTYAELAQAFSEVADDDAVGVAVIRGSGDKAFSAGGDLNEQGGRGPAEGRVHLRKVLRLGQVMHQCGKPIIASVAGFCVGGGHELHLFADMTVAADNAQFGQVGTRIGMVPVWGATEILPRIVGEKRAREMLFTTRFFSAEEALSMGLVNDVVPLDQLEARTREMAERVLDHSPQSLRIAKLSLNHAVESMWPAFTSGIEMISALYGTPEHVEGVTAFREKRKPRYREMRRGDV
jgi:naphthoate synthase/2-ketocyclohexanecarboxyl-CoA hydrolase